MPMLIGWENFYVIVGSAAGALIGLQFVVLTLIADMPGPPLAEAGAAFATPTIIHFAVVLFLSGIISAPWETIEFVSMAWGLFGFGGIIYMSLVIRHMKLQTNYQPVFEDWLFHALLPFVAYALLVGSTLIALWHPRPALFIVATALLILLLVGIHNAWDAVTYNVFIKSRQQDESKS